MPLLQRYLWTQAFWPTVLTLAALALLALLTQSLQTLDIIVENRQSALTFLKITGLALPQLIGIILPLAVFMAALYALNRMNGDSEIIVAKAAGASPWQIGSPLVRLGIMAMIAHLIITMALQPLSFREMRAEVLKVRTDLATQLVQPGEFVSPARNLTLYAREISPSGDLLDIIIHDARDAEDVITHTAKTGEIQRTPAGAALLLRNGAVQQTLIDGSLDVIEFKDYRLDLSDAFAFDTRLRLKPSDLYLHELLRPDPRTFVYGTQKQEFAAEGHSRLAAPLYNVALVMIALCFMIRGEHLRMGYGRRIIACAAIGFFVRILGFVAASSAEANLSLNILQYAIPGLTFLVCGVYLSRRRRVYARGSRRRREAYKATIAAMDNPVEASS
ncbi:LPS export ABC transporter permease LptF [Algimonas ampicilliniresistens]|jgi:lipopolysaccharide export system permease protein|uniref:LPS export ABC transporter permease LptF n=1 Tax=Algimonas ampicilliniresistens TaxID=1298735 RepID=A0ABQ5VBU5_9PROT|nr:LptF/LptG family permease [Algimonas ampicilliniresistens]GLQ24915.1 LPS export ABC transporter permease LptF [Algimonas ampicilliniresistens]